MHTHTHTHAHIHVHIYMHTHTHLFNVASKRLLLHDVPRQADALAEGTDVSTLRVAEVVDVNCWGGEGVTGEQT